jgi:hypothetical protein
VPDLVRDVYCTWQQILHGPVSELLPDTNLQTPPGQPEPTVLAFVIPQPSLTPGIQASHIVAFVMTEPVREELVRLLTGGIQVPKIEVPGRLNGGV